MALIMYHCVSIALLIMCQRLIVCWGRGYVNVFLKRGNQSKSGFILSHSVTSFCKERVLQSNNSDVK